VIEVQQGCYVDTNDALPLGTVTDIRIIKGAQLFEARARIVYSRVARHGAGVYRHRGGAASTLETWLAESRETSWLAETAEGQRVLMTIPVRVSGQAGVDCRFEEETHTRPFSAHWCVDRVSTAVHRGQRLTLSNVRTKGGAGMCLSRHIDSIKKIIPGGVESHSQSYVLARGLSAKRLDAPSPGCEIPLKTGEIELKSALAVSDSKQ